MNRADRLLGRFSGRLATLLAILGVSVTAARSQQPIPAVFLDAPQMGTTVGAGNDTQLAGAGCFTGLGQIPSTAPGRDVVYSFTAPDRDTYSFRVTGYSTPGNAVLYVASSIPTEPPPATVTTCLAAANRTTLASAEEVPCLLLMGGQTVYVFVDDAGTNAGNTFTLEVNRCAHETEPNDTPATADQFRCGIEGTISGAGEGIQIPDNNQLPVGTPIDMYNNILIADPRRMFAILDGVAANSNDFDLGVGDGTSVIEFDDDNNAPPFGALSPNLAGTIIPAGTTVYLEVSHASGDAEPYRLYRCMQPPHTAATVETEPNDTPATADTGPNLYFRGVIASPVDVDLFRFTASAGQMVQLGLDGDPLRDMTPINAALALLDGSGAVLVAVDDPAETSGAGPPAFAPGEGLLYRIRTTGTYYARVMAASAGDYLLAICTDCQRWPGTNLALSQTASHACAPASTQVTYNLTVTNTGTLPAESVVVSGRVSPNVTMASVMASPGTCSVMQPIDYWDCVTGQIPAGGTMTVTITGSLDDTMPAVSTGTVTSGVHDPSPVDDTATTVINGACDDGNACTTADACASGACVGGPPPNCDDGNVCTDDGCDPASGCVHVNNTAPCDDGNACTTADACSNGVCVGGPPPNCNDGNVCTEDGCDPASGCVHVSNTAPCDDGNACTTADACANGICVGGPPPNCEDGNVCTSDACDPATGCVHVNNTAPCDDGNACTTADACVNGTCVGGPPPNCDDGNVCTNDACNPASGCVHVNNTAPCDDGNACTTADACSNGVCVGGPPPNCNDGNVCTNDACDPATGCVHVNNTAPCDDGNACTTADTCQNGTCSGGPPANCDDGNPCTSDSCDPGTGCVHVNVPGPCDDGNACTIADACANGICVGGPPPNCDDGNVCTSDACDPASGCVHVNNTAPCDDGNACTTADACLNGACAGGPPLDCNDANVCTDDGCNPASGCVHVNNTAPCDDGNACSAGDVCCNGSCRPGPCAGTCPVTGEACIKDLFAQCVCVPGPIPCGGSGGFCDGECPDGEQCRYDETLQACACVGPQACGPSGSGGLVLHCGGTCPEGEVCVSDEDPTNPTCICETAEVPCRFTEPACGGDCPEGFACSATMNGCECEPSGPDCASSQAPHCGGWCGPDEICRPQPGGGGPCFCAPDDPPCGLTQAPQCGGFCPDVQGCDPGRALKQRCTPTGPGGPCVCQPETCALGPYPECGGPCPPGQECVPDQVQGTCSCQSAQPLTCGQAMAPECAGACSAGEICEADAQGLSCLCVPDDVPCGQTPFPTCNGDCPDDLVCTAGATTCSCEPPVLDCGSRTAPSCDGNCPSGLQCRPQIIGDGCQCAPVGTLCQDADAPLCGGSCPRTTQCTLVAGLCLCVPCTETVPTSAITMLWSSSSRLEWDEQQCAETYNAYRLIAPRIGSSGKDGVADTYGDCLFVGMTLGRFDDISVPPPGQVHYYSVTGRNTLGEGLLGYTPGGLIRTNVAPCP